MKNKALIILSPGFPADETDSTCLPSQQLFVKELNKNFPSLKIIVLAFQYPFLKSSYEWNGNSVISFGGRSKGKLKRLVLWRNIWEKLKKIKTENDIVGIFSFWCGECALIGSRFGRKNNLKHYSWICGQDAKRENNYVKWILPGANELIAMSDFLADEFYRNHKIFPDHIITNGIAANLFYNRITEKDICISGAGSLIPLKQYEVFISVVKNLKEMFPAINAVLCGKGPEENNLKSQITKAGLSTNISITGELPHHDVLDIMCRSKIFLHTSSYEGFSSACLEALAAGAHVISFCKPMIAPINHWHVVRTEKEMLNKAAEILHNLKTCYEPTLPYLMKDSAKKIMEL